MTSFSDKLSKERRIFPRLDAICPVLYQTSASRRWQAGTLVDFSATGVRIQCDELLLAGTPISIQFKPANQKAIPAISGEGNVVRCEPNEDMRYEISCKLTRVDPT